MKDKRRNIKDLNLQEVEQYILDKKFPKFRSTQIFEWIYKDVETFDQMTNLPKNIIEALKEDFYIERAVVAAKQASQVDKTKKYLLKFKDGNAVECVLMEYSYGRTLCISTQVGCRLGCAFCASTQGGLVRNLSCGEMMEQVMAVTRDIGERIGNIVLMGAGEPFDNYDEVIKFLRLINHEKTLNVGLRHITISTSGLVPKIYQFIEEDMPCTLAISLHAASNGTRNALMPINKKFNIGELMEACRHYIKKTNKRITFEYALIKDINDSEEDAHLLGGLLRGMLCHVNLIPMNKVEGKELQKSTKEKVNQFKKIVEEYGVETTIRRELGSDINAACGQLRQKFIEGKLEGQES